MNSPKDYLTDRVKEIIKDGDFGNQTTHNKRIEQLVALLTSEVESTYSKALTDMFIEIAKLAEPDERQFGQGDLTTNLDNIYEIQTKLLEQRKALSYMGGGK